MKKIFFIILLVSISNTLLASEINCFSHKDKQFHLAVGPEHISDFSFTSFSAARKIGRILDGGALEELARSGAIFIENEYCQENEKEIRCQILPSTLVNIYNVFGRVRISKNGLTGQLVYIKDASKLIFELTNSFDQKLMENITFSSSECRINN